MPQTMLAHGCAKLLPLCYPLDYSRQAPLSIGIFQEKYWSGLPFPPPGDLPDPGTEPKSLMSPALQVDSLFMAAVTICSDFGAQKDKVSHCFHCFPVYFP